MSAPTPAVRSLLLDRDDHRCVMCGTGYALEAQHRQAVGMGGSKARPLICELIVLCSRHNFMVEADAPMQAAALRFGWKVRKHLEAECGAVPVFYPLEGRWFRLTRIGTREHVLHVEAMRMMREVYGDAYDPQRGLVR